MVFLICQDRDSCVTTVTRWIIIIVFQLRIWILSYLVVTNNDICHRISTVINLDTIQTVSERDVIFDENLIPVVDIQTFTVVVVCIVSSIGNAIIIRPCHWGCTISSTTVQHMTVVWQDIIVYHKITLVTEHNTSNTVVMKERVGYLVTVHDRNIWISDRLDFIGNLLRDTAVTDWSTASIILLSCRLAWTKEDTGSVEFHSTNIINRNMWRIVYINTVWTSKVRLAFAVEFIVFCVVWWIIGVLDSQTTDSKVVLVLNENRRFVTIIRQVCFRIVLSILLFVKHDFCIVTTWTTTNQTFYISIVLIDHQGFLQKDIPWNHYGSSTLNLIGCFQSFLKRITCFNLTSRI